MFIEQWQNDVGWWSGGGGVDGINDDEQWQNALHPEQDSQTKSVQVYNANM